MDTPRLSEQLPEQLTVLIDTREKYPLLFPSSVRVEVPPTFSTRLIPVITQTRTLKTGDYQIAELSDTAIVERKAGQNELIHNLADHKDSIRQAKAFKRLSQACRWPILLVEAHHHSFYSPSSVPNLKAKLKHHELIVQRLFSAAVRFGLHPLFIPPPNSPARRRQLGCFILQYIIAVHLNTAPTKSSTNQPVQPITPQPTLEAI